MKKFLENIPLVTLTLLCCVFLYTCNTNRNVNKVIKKNAELTLTIDSLKSDFQTRLEIEGYKISARTLYDNNAVVRTKERPDDIMHQYDVEIQKLSKKLK